MDKAALDAQNARVTEEFRENGGRIGGPLAGMSVLLLHHRGARSGEPRLNPLAYSETGDSFVIVASAGGQQQHPHWFGNLMAHPQVEIEVGARRLQVTARLARGAERERLFAEHAKAMPMFNDYAERAAGQRELPVVVLTPIR